MFAEVAYGAAGLRPPCHPGRCQSSRATHSGVNPQDLVPVLEWVTAVPGDIPADSEAANSTTNSLDAAQLARQALFPRPLTCLLP
jgi:hypothetical protein